MQLCKPDDKVIQTKMATQSAVVVSLLLSVLTTEIHFCASTAFCTTNWYGLVGKGGLAAEC